MPKYEFVGGNGKKKARKKKIASTDGAEYEFTNKEGETFQFVGATSVSGKREETKRLRNDLGACLVDMAQEWTEDPVDLDEAKRLVLECVAQAESEGGKPQEWRRMRLIIDQIDELDELVKYIYNYLLRASGLSTTAVVGRRD